MSSKVRVTLMWSETPMPEVEGANIRLQERGLRAENLIPDAGDEIGLPPLETSGFLVSGNHQGTVAWYGPIVEQEKNWIAFKNIRTAFIKHKSSDL
jgi:hypothetical protein